MWPIRTIYGSLPYFDAYCDETVREQTNIHLAVHSDFKSCYTSNILSLFNVDPPFQKDKCAVIYLD